MQHSILTRAALGPAGVFLLLPLLLLIGCGELCDSAYDCPGEICREGECMPPDGTCAEGSECLGGAFCLGGQCCGDGACEDGEPGNCYIDCMSNPDPDDADCGDGVCEYQEDCLEDCGRANLTLTTCDNSYSRPITACNTPYIDQENSRGQLAGFWGIAPLNLCYYGNPLVGASTACGPLQAGNAVYCPYGGYIAFHQDWMAGLEQKYGPDVSAIIHAHEWGHLIQHGLGYWWPGRSWDTSLELHADCLAGLYSFHSGGDVDSWETASQLLFELVILEASSTPWGAPLSHGTYEERYGRFLDGVQAAAVAARARGQYDLCGFDPRELVVEVCGIP